MPRLKRAGKRPEAHVPSHIATKKPPAETLELRKGIERFKNLPLSDFINDAPTNRRGQSITVGAVRWGVYAFYDYDGEPIYVGQTRESLGSRIGRHLTNQRTDAVAMSVLDPFEVRTLEVWPLPEYQTVRGDPKRSRAVAEAAEHLNSLERTVFNKLVAASGFGKILNEKDPPEVSTCDLPPSIRDEIISDEVRSVREHPDVRIARRAQTIARLAYIIAGRDVQVGLRRALATQADRLALLANERFVALGGERSVEVRDPNNSDEDGEDS